jgi:Low molecular weight phosphotyrosine protein phosphatase
VKKVLFVCTANTCRSPMAQAIFDALAEDEGLPFRVESAGTEAPKRRPWLRTRWQLWRRGSTRGSAAHGGERGDGRGGRIVLAMDPPQIVALDLLEGDSPLVGHTLPAYTTSVAGEGGLTLTGSPWPPTESTSP